MRNADWNREAPHTGAVKGGMDIVWDDMIDLKVEYPPTDKILGPEKYASVNVDIVKGLGIPDALVGGSDLSTRNRETAFVQLKTLTGPTAWSIASSNTRRGFSGPEWAAAHRPANCASGRLDAALTVLPT